MEQKAGKGLPLSRRWKTLRNLVLLGAELLLILGVFWGLVWPI